MTVQKTTREPRGGGKNKGVITWKSKETGQQLNGERDPIR